MLLFESLHPLWPEDLVVVGHQIWRENGKHHEDLGKICRILTHQACICLHLMLNWAVGELILLHEIYACHMSILNHCSLSGIIWVHGPNNNLQRWLVNVTIAHALWCIMLHNWLLMQAQNETRQPWTNNDFQNCRCSIFCNCFTIYNDCRMRQSFQENKSPWRHSRRVCAFWNRLTDVLWFWTHKSTERQAHFSLLFKPTTTLISPLRLHLHIWIFKVRRIICMESILCYVCLYASQWPGQIPRFATSSRWQECPNVRSHPTCRPGRKYLRDWNNLSVKSIQLWDYGSSKLWMVKVEETWGNT